MKVRFTLSIGFPAAKHEDFFDMPDDATDAQIDQEYDDWCSNYLDGGWSKVKATDATDAA